jgi:hypothetical protein
MTSVNETRADRGQARADDTKVERRRRQTEYSGVHYRLGIPASFKDPKFMYYWANDVPGRLEELTVHDDWDYVKLDTNRKVISSSDPSGAISREVGYDGARMPMRAYLLRKRKEYYEQDYARNVEVMDARYQRMTDAGAADGDGTLSTDARHAYKPSEIAHAFPKIRRG